MAVIEAIQTVLDLLNGIGDFTFHGISIYLLAKKESPPE